jgi:hypothetical protein
VARAPDADFVRLRVAIGNFCVVDTLSTSRPDVSRALGFGEDVDFGFSRLLRGELPSCAYSISIIQRIDAQDIACALILRVIIP